MQSLKSGFIIKGTYAITEKKGNGTLGTAVYLGHDLEHDRDVIIRIIPPDLLSDKETISRFLQGAEIAKKLQHPNILAVLDAGDEDGIKYLVTHYEKGFFLNDYLEHRGQLDESESVRLIKALSEALNYAWKEQKIIHRNISPENILVGKGNVPLLIDFDLAKSLVSNTNLTLDGFTIGNPMYMSPEQARGDQVDFHSDIYCLGLVFYHLLAGSPPFAGKPQLDILRAQILENHAPVKTQNSTITDACVAVLDKMLAKELKHRYQNWEDVINDLNALLKHEAPAASNSNVQTASQYKMQALHIEDKKQGANWKIIASIAVLILIVSAIGIGVSLRKQEQPESKQPQVIEKQIVAERQLTADVPVPDSKVKPQIEVASGNVKPVLDSKAVAKSEADIKPLVKETVKDDSEKKPVIKKIKEPQPEKKQVEQVKTVDAKPVEDVAPSKDLKKVERQRKACLNNVKQINTALQMYANVFEGKYPKPSGAVGLDLLRSNGFLELPQVFVSPLTESIAALPDKPITEEHCDYVYTGGLSEFADSKTPILWTKPETHKDYGIILYVNGDVKEYNGSNWPVNIKQPKATK